MKKSATLKKIISWAFLATILSLFSVYFINNAADFKNALANIRLSWLPILIIALMLTSYIRSILWAYLIKSLGCTLSYGHLSAIWHLSIIGNFIPGSIWMIVGRLYQLKKNNVPVATSSYSIAMEQIFNIFSAILIVLLSPQIFRLIHLPAWSSLLLLPFVVIIFFPDLLGKLIWKIGFRRIDLRTSFKLPFVKVNINFLGHLFIQFIGGGAIILMLKLFGAHTPDIDLFTATGIAAASFAIGYLSFLTPNGIGVKEGMLVFFLSKYIPMTSAILIAITARFWSLSASCIGALTAYFFLKIKGKNDILSFWKQSRANKPLRVLFLVSGNPKTGLSPSSRFRIYAYMNRFSREEQFRITIRPSIPAKHFHERIFFRKQSLLSLILLPAGFLVMFANRIIDVIKSFFFDVVVIQRPFFPGKTFPLLEILICRINKHIIFDFDDAVFAYHKKKSADRNSLFYRLIEDQDNVARIIRRSSHIVAGNKFLADYALKLNSNVTIIPTPVDTDCYIPKNQFPDSHGAPVIGWIGTSGNLPYLETLAPAFRKLQEKHKFTLKIVCNPIAHKLNLEGTEYLWINWDIDKEKQELFSFDIGIMPLEDNVWAKGKCGFKILQYMACAIPVVASSVGANIEIIQDGKNGFLANSTEEWSRKLAQLISNPELRKVFGEEGRKTVESKYSLNVTYPLLKEVLSKVSA